MIWLPKNTFYSFDLHYHLRHKALHTLEVLVVSTQSRY
jgi:hypothetical protein